MRLLVLIILCTLQLSAMNTSGSDTVWSVVEYNLNSLNYVRAKKILDSISKVKSQDNPQNKIIWHLKYHQYHYRLKDFSSAYDCLEHAEKLSYSIKDSQFLPSILVSKATIVRALGDYDLSSKLTTLASGIAININDSFFMLKVRYVKFVNKLSLIESRYESGYSVPDSLSNYYIRIHNSFVKAYETYSNQYRSDYISVLFNRAIFYSMVKPDSAILLFQDITRISQRENRILPLCNGYSFIGDCYFKIKNYKSSKEYLLKSIAIADKIGDYEVNIKNYETLYKIEKLFDNHEKALHYLEKVLKLKNILDDRHKKGYSLIPKQIRELAVNEMKIKKLEQEQTHLKEREKSNKLLLITTILGSFFILCTVILFSKNIQRKQKLREIYKDQEITKLEFSQLELKNEQSNRELEARTEGYETAQEFIARELHDQVANSIGALKLKLESSLKKDNFNATSKVFIEHLDKIYNRVRNLSHNLYIPDDEETDVIRLIDDFATELQESRNMHISYSIYPEVGGKVLTNKIKKELFLVLRELLINITKHSNAKEIDLNINKFDTEIQVLLSDNGKVNSNTDNQSNGIGIKNIQWRIENLNGKFEVIFNEQIGTQWHITIPI